MTTHHVEIIEVFQRHRVPFVIIGGHAVYAHGHRRETEDVDLVWRRSPEAEQALLAALTELQAEYLTNEIDPATRLERAVRVSVAYIRAEHLMMLWVRKGFLDLFDYIPGYPAEGVNLLFDSAVEIEGRPFASLHWLRRMKEAAGRTKDRIDLENLPKD